MGTVGLVRANSQPKLKQVTQSITILWGRGPNSIWWRALCYGVESPILWGRDPNIMGYSALYYGVKGPIAFGRESYVMG